GAQSHVLLSAQRYRDPHGRFMVFALDSSDDADSVFWKALVRVNVTIQSTQGRAEGPHRLSVKQFSALFRALQDHMTPAEYNQAADGAAPGPGGPMRKITIRSASGTTPGGPGSEGDPDAKECPICMDAAPDIILPCAHAFCKKCL